MVNNVYRNGRVAELHFSCQCGHLVAGLWSKAYYIQYWLLPDSLSVGYVGNILNFVGN